MLKNYFLTAVAVLKRRKFFTFVSLFGISFTLSILIILTSFIDHAVSPGYPETDRHRSLYINFVQLIDTKNNGRSKSPASYYFLDHYAGSLKTPAKLAIATMYTATNTYRNNKKMVINMKHTNHAFWQVMHFKFLEGKPYTEQQIANAEKVAVITEETRQNYFGNVSAIGKFIEADNVEYKVCGVVKNVPVTQFFSYADMFLPYTVSKINYKVKSIQGQYSGILRPESTGDLEKLRKEYDQVVARIPKTAYRDFDILVSKADSYLVSFTRNAFGNGNDTGLGVVLLALGIFLFFFMLLPTLNLVNINISRIMERSAEIGVRKAFGASSTTLVGQFLVENLILTFLGGMIGTVLAFIVLQIINSSNLLPDAVLTINLTVLFWSLLVCLVFGLLSGGYPAWRMSRLHVVTALKSS